MPRAATEVMQSVIFSAVLDAIAALKAGSGGLPNNLLRDIQAIHNNVTFADLPKELQDAISASTRTAFTQLLKEGYSVAPRDSAPVRQAPRHGEVVDRGARGLQPSRPGSRGPRSDGTSGARPGGGRPPGPGGRPRGPRKPQG
ncbi:MAG TPA: hypothetical protein VM913_06645 [Sphingomicrobium sp.]|jgi:hypothetical protein|nr:hypothetical protein [Sphingomicrobium sp.]